VRRKSRTVRLAAKAWQPLWRATNNQPVIGNLQSQKPTTAALAPPRTRQVLPGAVNRLVMRVTCSP
jgi:hypothetical protein